MPWIEPEQLAKAKSIDLYSYLTIAEPGNIKRCGQDEYCLKDHDSLKVSASNGKWHWHSRSTGGTTALQYLIVVRGYSLPQAAQMVLESKADPYLPHVQPLPPKPFALPPAHSNSDKVTAYLCGKRGISRGIVQGCLADGSLYENAHFHSCVFVGYDEHLTPRHAALRATVGDFKQDVEGSDKRHTWALKTQNRACKVLRVYESAIDALSHASLRLLKGEPWQEEHYLSLAGVSPLAITEFLSTHANITTVRLCLDNDQPGQLAAQRITDVLVLSRPPLKIALEPPRMGSDYNQCLQLERYNRRREKSVKKQAAMER